MKHRVAVIGLGYVGLPLAVEFGKIYPTVGYDINSARIEELSRHYDRTKEIEPKEFKPAKYLKFTLNKKDITGCNIYIVTVPTPIDSYNRPDITLLKKASEAVGSVLSKGDIVIYESTVYPGCTEEDCVPVLECASGLKYNRDFFCGYSPERINPGDKAHRLPTIQKITSGSTPKIAEIVDRLYASIVTAGTHKASSIKVAEAAKVIENSQRDINIAFINELSIIFSKMGIRTRDVLAAARTKWNFLPFEPGLVGGHCIGVDPYYLTHKAEGLGYIPQIILAGRRLNDSMGPYVAGQAIKLLIKKGCNIKGAKVLVLGITFKENCPDIRNSKVVDVVRELKDFGCIVDVYDPYADPQEVMEEYGIHIVSSDKGLGKYNAIVAAVAHQKFKRMRFDKLRDKDCVMYDVKNILARADGAL
jgi:UDP-N-acetyl-D-galactosamine dehydrogenase